MRLEKKLRRKGLRGSLLLVLTSWLETRRAQVVVEGAKSQAAALKDQVFQGTVLGPPLWNVFFEDARHSVNKEGFSDIFFADDLNCFRSYARSCDNAVFYEELTDCQKELHRWGAANRVTFDSGKEWFYVLHRTQAQGNEVKILGFHGASPWGF